MFRKNVAILIISSFLTALAGCGGSSDSQVTEETPAAQAGGLPGWLAGELTKADALLPALARAAASVPERGLLHGSSGAVDQFQKYLGKWTTGCLPYSLTSKGAGTIRMFELSSIKPGGILIGASRYFEYRDAACKEAIGLNTYDLAAVYSKTVAGTDLNAPLTGEADIFSVVVTHASKTDPARPFTVGLYSDEQFLRLGDGDTWFKGENLGFRRIAE